MLVILSFGVIPAWRIFCGFLTHKNKSVIRIRRRAVPLPQPERSSMNTSHMTPQMCYLQEPSATIYPCQWHSMVWNYDHIYFADSLQMPQPVKLWNILKGILETALHCFQELPVFIQSIQSFYNTEPVPDWFCISKGRSNSVCLTHSVTQSEVFKNMHIVPTPSYDFLIFRCDVSRFQRLWTIHFVRTFESCLLLMRCRIRSQISKWNIFKVSLVEFLIYNTINSCLQNPQKFNTKI